MRILIAEDDPMAHMLLSAALTEWGYEVSVVEDGQEALVMLQAPGAPNLAILDWMMPGLDGPEVCERFREQNPASPTHLILLSGRDSKTDLATAIKAGASDYVVKPFNYDELKLRVDLGRTIVQLKLELSQRK
jgi:DNA-binding response OmpR family regulator